MPQSRQSLISVATRPCRDAIGRRRDGIGIGRIAIIGVIVFGKKLPEVGKNLGKGIVEFKKGLHEIEDHVDQAASPTSPPPQQTQPMGYKFDPYTGKPLDSTTTTTTPPSSGNPV